MENTHTVEPITPDEVRQLAILAAELKAASHPTAAVLEKSLRERGRTRVLARELLLELPREKLTAESAQELFAILAPWPTCSTRAA